MDIGSLDVKFLRVTHQLIGSQAPYAEKNLLGLLLPKNLFLTGSIIIYATLNNSKYHG
jgi:hypothetical protein